MPKYYLNTSTLSLLPCGPIKASLNPGIDVLKLWPHEYESSLENAQWADAVRWGGIKGYHKGPLFDCAYEPFAFNYAFCALHEYIPSGYKNGQLSFECDTHAQYVRKMENFYAAHQYTAQYPTYTRMDSVLGLSERRFVEEVAPGIYSMAAHINFLDRQLRLWEYNHTEVWPTLVTTTTDGAPIAVCCPQNRYLQRALKSGKYKEYAMKFDYSCCVAAGFPIDYAGLHLGCPSPSPTGCTFWGGRSYSTSPGGQKKVR